MVLNVTPPDLKLLIAFLNSDLDRLYPQFDKVPKNKFEGLMVGFETESDREFGDRIGTDRPDPDRQTEKILYHAGKQKAKEAQANLRNILRGVLKNDRSAWLKLAVEITDSGSFRYELISPTTIIRKPVFPAGRGWLYKIVAESLETGDFKKLRLCKQCQKFFTAKHRGMRFCRRQCYQKFFAADAARRVKKSREARKEKEEPFQKFNTKKWTKEVSRWRIKR
jgi:hypothetical protein